MTSRWRGELVTAAAAPGAFLTTADLTGGAAAASPRSGPELSVAWWWAQGRRNRLVVVERSGTERLSMAAGGAGQGRRGLGPDLGPFGPDLGAAGPVILGFRGSSGEPIP